MKRKVCSLVLGMVSVGLLAGCKADKEENYAETQQKKVELTVWGAEEDEELMGKVIQSFEEHYQGRADFQISFQAQSESGCKDVLLNGLEEGADVFTFADDQLSSLAAAGALDPVGKEEIKDSALPAAVEAASVGDTLYAYPLTADNGYFLYYNKKYFSDKQVEKLDDILKVAADENKLFVMDWSSAWYVYSFFGNTGLEIGLNDDGITNYCTWNKSDGDIKGTDVARAMLDIAGSRGFDSRTDEEFLSGVKDGSVIAGVSGVWNAVAIGEAWGKDMGASKLPSYTCDGRQVQMASFSGCKLIGVNAYSKHPVWAARLAEWITNEDNQTLRFEMRGDRKSVV